jgi:hypothetical protein
MQSYVFTFSLNRPLIFLTSTHSLSPTSLLQYSKTSSQIARDIPPPRLHNHTTYNTPSHSPSLTHPFSNTPSPLYHRSLEPSLRQIDGKVYYASSITEMDTLFGDGEICLTFSYKSKHTSVQINSGAWSNNTIGYVLDSGTLANVNFIAVGNNGANRLGGVVAANYMAKVSLCVCVS